MRSLYKLQSWVKVPSIIHAPHFNANCLFWPLLQLFFWGGFCRVEPTQVGLVWVWWNKKLRTGLKVIETKSVLAFELISCSYLFLKKYLPYKTVEFFFFFKFCCCCCFILYLLEKFLWNKTYCTVPSLSRFFYYYYFN